ncbi:DUF6431 domain-containing protein [Neobacillus drentensis]
MSVIGTRDRKSIDSSGENKTYNIRRLRCTNRNALFLLLLHFS